uniref:hypothetical protein n=1 Tax=Micrococcus luteus TaxID=1270 RepID=UPI00155DD9B0|nr:hypothetical protein [Micrococcus luteus]
MISVGVFFTIGVIGALFPGLLDGIDWWEALLTAAAVGLVVLLVSAARNHGQDVH